MKYLPAPGLSPISNDTAAKILPQLKACPVCRNKPDLTLSHNGVRIHCVCGCRSMEIVYTDREMLEEEPARLPKLTKLVKEWQK